ncbi:hypothetical protein NC651_019796 [Populus alba x Populus x berolinensis]|nr:hypothetical protein NC651_019796 [Populus alba x Populus x berolinensis]
MEDQHNNIKAAVRFELPCNQECSSLWSPRKMVYRSDWTGVVLPVYPVKMGQALSLADPDLFNTYTGFHRHQVRDLEPEPWVKTTRRISSPIIRRSDELTQHGGYHRHSHDTFTDKENPCDFKRSGRENHPVTLAKANTHHPCHFKIKVHSGIRSEVGQLFKEINAFCFLSKLSISYPSMFSTQREQGSNELTFSISNIQVMFLVL